MYSGGYAGKVLRINLSNRTSREEWLSEEMARDFIGGAGFGIKHLFDEAKPGIDPLGSDNMLVFAPGPFTGAGVPCSSVDSQGVAHSPSSIVEICGSRRSVVGGRILEGAI